MRRVSTAMLPAAILLAGSLYGVPASAYVPPPAPDVIATPTAMPLAPPGAAPSSAAGSVGVIGSMREIAHARATTTFCSTLRDNTVVAADATIDFENSLLVTMVDIFHMAHADNILLKHRFENLADADLVRLADLSRQGGAELVNLRKLAAVSTPEQSKALLGLRDSLDGAKARQHFLTKQVAQIVGELAEEPTFTTIDIEADSFVDRVSNGANGVAIGAQDSLRSLLPGDEEDGIEHDLDTAARNAQAAVTLGHCATTYQDGDASIQPQIDAMPTAEPLRIPL